MMTWYTWKPCTKTRASATQRLGLAVWVCALALSLSISRDATAAPLAPGYLVQTVATPGAATGDVLATGGAVFVGVGSYGAGQQSVVRLDGGGATTIATGFNSLSGFAYDSANDRLIVGDNGLEAPGGAVTGDTVYGINNPFATPGSAPTALSLELAASGSLPGAADVHLDPLDPNRLFVTDSWTQQLMSVNLGAGSTSVLHSGLGYAAGLDVVGSTLFVGDLDATFFTGTIWTVPVASPTDPLNPFLTGLLGEYDLELASDGSLLATASAFLVDSQILQIDPLTGDVTVLASGFDFVSGLDEEGGTIYAVDGGTLYALTIPEPAAAWLVAFGVSSLVAHSRKNRTWRNRV